jgi:PAS domain S-box-containing protein
LASEDELGLRVLLVGADPQLRRVLELLIAEHRVVQSVCTSDEACAAALADIPDLVVLDFSTPGLDGVELMSRLRAEPRTRRVPVLVIAAVPDEEVRIRALEAGAAEVVDQPVSERELLLRVGGLLEVQQERRSALRRSEEILRAVLEGATDAVLRTTGDGQVVFWNGEAEKMFGRPREQVLGQVVGDLGILEIDWTELVQRAESARVTAQAVKADGSRFPVEIALTTVEASGTRFHNAFIEDVTERREAESERARLLEIAEVARRESEAANRAKDHFLATLSHEIRTPLNAIVGWAHLMSTGHLDAATMAKAIETIQRNAKVQNQLIADLLDVSRIVAGKLELELLPLAIAPLVAGVIDTMAPAAQAKGIVMVADLQEPELMVHADAARLQQVFWNLLSNAIKFTPQRGSVRVNLSRDGGHAVVVVRDTGPGIDANFLPHVFEAFAQSGGNARLHGGLGLGLAIARHIVEIHDGTIGVQSGGAAGGTTFRVAIPVAQERASTEAVTRTVSATGSQRLRGLRILVVDDEPDSREVIAKVLALHGAIVSSAASGRDGLVELERERPHVLLSDVEMPDMDGYELLRRIRELPHSRGGLTPAAALTGYAGPSDRLRALTAGFHVHVGKPVQPAELVRVVAMLAGRERST